jgi:hypothetical protein
MSRKCFQGLGGESVFGFLYLKGKNREGVS